MFDLYKLSMGNFFDHSRLSNRYNKQKDNDASCLAQHVQTTQRGKETTMTDDELIERIRDGDEHSAEELITRYYSAILRYCRLHCTNDAAAEDLTQETFLRVFKNLSGYRKIDRFKSWLYTIANHICVDESRKMTWKELDEEPVGECPAFIELEDRDEIDRLMQRLSPEQREAVILRFSEQLSFTEIAKVTDCSLRTAQSRVRCALEIMRKGWRR